MGISFLRAPLVEIIAELRWEPSISPLPRPPQAGPQPLPALYLGANQVENFLHRFGGEIYAQGFDRTERLLPSGVPVPQGQVMARFKRKVTDDANVLYQAGIGVF